MIRHQWHSSVGKLQKTSLNAEINVTPLVDVCLVLLIIFMVVTPMLQKGVPVNLPVTEEPERTPDTDKQLQISVKGDRIVKYGKVLDVLKACREVCFNNVRLNSRPKRTPGQGGMV